MMSGHLSGRHLQMGTANNDSVYFHYLFSQGKFSPTPPLFLCVCVYLKITVGQFRIEYQ